jgi:hypothetical protein
VPDNHLYVVPLAESVRLKYLIPTDYTDYTDYPQVRGLASDYIRDYAVITPGQGVAAVREDGHPHHVVFPYHSSQLV